MAIYQLAGYRINPGGVDKVKRAIAEFVDYIQANEPGTQLYLAWSEQADPTRFVHVFIFEDEAAMVAHSQSDAVARFEAVYTPELSEGAVVFTDYDWVAGKR